MAIPCSAIQAATDSEDGFIRPVQRKIMSNDSFAVRAGISPESEPSHASPVQRRQSIEGRDNPKAVLKTLKPVFPG